jgi:predicted aspartyl protease
MAIGGKEFCMDCSDPFIPCFRLDLFISSPNPQLTDLYPLKNILIDTGSDYTLLPNNLITKLKLIWTGDTKTMIQADGITEIEVKIYPAKIKIDGVIEGIFEIGGIDCEDKDSLIGMNLINELHLLLNCPNRTFEIVNRNNYIQPITP